MEESVISSQEAALRKSDIKNDNHSADSWQHASVHLRLKNSHGAGKSGKSLGASPSLMVRAETLEEVELKEPSNRSPFSY